MNGDRLEFFFAVAAVTLFSVYPVSSSPTRSCMPPSGSG